MTEPGPRPRRAPAAEGNPDSIPKRRKIRKGTQSCWECKRRKTRCTFAAPTDTTCDGCKSRKTACVGQDYPDDSQPATSAKRSEPNRVETRLERVESLLERLIKSSGGADGFRGEPLDSQGRTGQNSRHAYPSSDRRASKAKAAAPRHQSLKGSHRYPEVSYGLLEAWPSQRDLDIIMGIPIGTAGLFHGLICAPYTQVFEQDTPQLQELLELPSHPAESHPVLLARKLLMLATFVQGVPSQYSRDLERLTTDYRDIMSRLVETVNRLVTSNDELVDSLEGLECIMVESMYYNNAGNLRRSWLTMRRAMVMAQMSLGHHGTRSSTVKTLDSATRNRIDPEHMWYRILQSDGYLSLMLGLPQGSVENTFASEKVLQSCSPMERMERLDTLAGSRILQRNKSNIHDLATTQEIDKILQDAAACMPAQWWLKPSLECESVGDMKSLREIIRIMNQLAHFNILIQLHLPHLLRFSEDRSYDYSKVTAANASRELLSRFVHFRTRTQSSVYCRGVDFLAFIATTTMCLFHIDAHCQKQRGNAHGASFQFSHQRLMDRGLMERTFETMEHMVQQDNDRIAMKIVGILESLLLIEAEAADGKKYSADSSVEDEETKEEDKGLECRGRVSRDGKGLSIRIPYLGTITMKPGNTSRSPVTSANAEPEPATWLDNASMTRQVQCESEGGMSKEQELRGDSVGGQSLNPDWHPVPSRLDLFDVDTSNMHEGGDPQLEDIDTWALQGVDMVVFDSLLRGAQGSDTFEDFLI